MLSDSQQRQVARDVHALANYRVHHPAKVGKLILYGFLLSPLIGLLIGLASAARKALGW